MVWNQKTNRLCSAKEITFLVCLHAHSLSIGKHLLLHDRQGGMYDTIQPWPWWMKLLSKRGFRGPTTASFFPLLPAKSYIQQQLCKTNFHSFSLPEGSPSPHFAWREHEPEPAGSYLWQLLITGWEIIRNAARWNWQGHQEIRRGIWLRLWNQHRFLKVVPADLQWFHVPRCRMPRTAVYPHLRHRESSLLHSTAYRGDGRWAQRKGESPVYSPCHTIFSSELS